MQIIYFEEYDRHIYTYKSLEFRRNFFAYRIRQFWINWFWTNLLNPDEAVGFGEKILKGRIYFVKVQSPFPLSHLQHRILWYEQ